MIETPIDRSTDLVAVAAVASPWWLDPLHSGSEVAALLLPIFGVLWLILQIYTHIRKYRKSNEDKGRIQ